MTRARSGAAGLRAQVVARRADGFTLDVDLYAPADRTTALLGPNGAGKSTLIATLAGLLPIAAGSITLNGRVLDSRRPDRFVVPEQRGLGVVFQDGMLFGHLTVLQNVAFGPRSRGASRHAAGDVARHWLSRLGLEAIAHRKPGQLSGGQAQRVALCRALAAGPDALLLDEPLSALDVTSRAGMRRVLAAHLRSFDGPRLLITHDPVEAFLLADLVHVLEGGALTQSGTPDELRRRPRTPYVADLAGTNLVAGNANGAEVRTGGHLLRVADGGHRGGVLLAVSPRAITLHREPPQGSPRNRWPTVVALVEHLGDRVRVQVGDPLPLTVEVTAAAAADLDLRAGARVWVAIKATEIRVTPDGDDLPPAIGDGREPSR